MSKQLKRLMTDLAKGKITQEEIDKLVKPKTKNKLTGGKKHSK